MFKVVENTKKPQNPNAFPNTDPSYFGANDGGGMTLRDYFANSAMQGLVISTTVNESSIINRIKIFFGIKGYTADFNLSEKEISISAYSIADAMLKQREL